MIAFVLLRVFLILLLVAANAFFAAAEFSLVSVRDTRIQQLISAGRIGARLVESMRFVHEVPHAAVYAHTIAIAIAFSLITYMHVILGELVPKTLALQRA